LRDRRAHPLGQRQHGLAEERAVGLGVIRKSVVAGNAPESS
jgi:hypothetical protein